VNAVEFTNAAFARHRRDGAAPKRSREAARRSKAIPEDFATILQSTVLEFSTANPRMILLLVVILAFGTCFGTCWRLGVFRFLTAFSGSRFFIEE
jgi:hypothetical protein